MSNISFANPYLILILIPVLLLLIIPFFITFKKDNIGIRNIFSLILHVIISTLIVLVIAGMSYKTAIDETNIYVLADLSYSTNRNIDTIDNYVSTLENNVDNQTKVGVVCFGTDTPYVLMTPGEKVKSVRSVIDQERIDQSGTDIAGALRYTASLFDDNVVKRIILITDGDETNSGNVLNVVNELYTQDIFVDAIYLDDNLPSDVAEVQINSVNYTMSTYQNKAENVQITIQSNLEHKTSLVELLKDGQVVQTRAPQLSKGINVITMSLDTATAGEFKYDVRVTVSGDSSSYNNNYSFTQVVTENVKILYLASNDNEVDKANNYFKKDNTEVTYININNGNVPYTIEDLCNYDEFVLSDVNVLNIRNSGQFIANLDEMVSRYSKTLITLGNTYTQNGTDEYEYDTLASMLPIKYGESDRDGKLITIVIDISKSMRESYHLDVAKESACKIVDLAQESDNIMVITMSGETQVLQMSTTVTDGTKLKVKEAINNIEERQGTLIGSTLQNTYELIGELPFLQKQIYLISDGRNMIGDPNDAVSVANNIYVNTGTTISSIQVGSPDAENLLEKISQAAAGRYYTANEVKDLEELFDNEISSDITATVVDDGVSREIVVNKENDVTLTDIEGDIEAVRGFYVGTTKNSATTILETIWSSETKNTEVPIYAYWRYGNGLVASFSCDINHNIWLRNWGSGTNGEKFLQNLSGANLPTKREDVPLLVETEAIGTNTYLYVDTPTLNPNAKLTLEITDPSGDVNERDLVYTTEDYETNFETKEVGTYRLKITYTLEASNASPITYSKEYIYNVSYTEEYNSFNYYEISNLNHMVNTGNPVYEDADSINLSIDETKVTTYTYDFTVLFMTIAICLFVVDIFIRKVKWADIKQIFSHKH